MESNAPDFATSAKINGKHWPVVDQKGMHGHPNAHKTLLFYPPQRR